MVPHDEHWGKKTLFLGDVNSGKTQKTLELLAQVIDRKSDEIAVLDLAPEKTQEIGGKIDVPSHPRVSYYTTTITPPRLMGRNIAEVRTYARQNREAIEKLFSRYLKDPKKILFINDVSLYLQMGDLDRLLEVLRPSHTAIINGYYGKTFGESEFSQKEKKQMDQLAKLCDRVIHL